MKKQSTPRRPHKEQSPTLTTPVKPYSFTLKDGRVVSIRPFKRLENPRAFQTFARALVASDALIRLNRVPSLLEEIRYVITSYRKTLRGQSVHWLAIDKDGKVVGNAGAERGAYRNADLVEANIAVHPDYQGQGLGSALFHTVVQDALEKLKPRVLYLVAYGNNASALDLYRKAGFVETSRRKGWHEFQGKPVDEVTMEYRS